MAKKNGSGKYSVIHDRFEHGGNYSEKEVLQKLREWFLTAEIEPMGGDISKEFRVRRWE
jgi:hypothetical protein